MGLAGLDLDSCFSILINGHKASLDHVVFGLFSLASLHLDNTNPISQQNIEICACLLMGFNVSVQISFRKPFFFSTRKV